jgi:short-subunit dehydrogenase
LTVSTRRSPAMRPSLKPVSAQTIVITGATSGLGLATARLAAGRGAKLLLTARNEQALRALCEELHARGGVAAYEPADVADEAQMRAVAAKADSLYGGFDTWINNAGVGIYGKLEETPLEDQRRLFETNYWGVVNGSLVAAEHLKARAGGGAIINVGSVLSDFAIPIQGAYSASKHAVKGFTNVLRMELMREGAPVSVTLIRPSAIDTPYKDHARNLTGAPVKNPAPVYAAPLVAQAILYAASHKTRELSVGSSGPILAALGAIAPWAAEPILAWAAPALQRDEEGRRGTRTDNLHQAGQDLRERAYYKGVRESSLFASAQMRPRATLAIAVVAGLAAGAAFFGGRKIGRAAETPPPAPEPVVRPSLAARLGLG